MIGLSPLLHRYPKPAVRFNIIGTGFPNRIILFKSLIANMAGFLWLLITSIMIEVFKVASVQWLIFYQ